MGVKSLWSLLTPVGRPVMLDNMEGKTMAIDSSIWIYQFQATMRDNDGRVLVNAHLVGFLRRICKLLFYGIKPVFVFDGGAPALKRMTISERKKKKSGAAESHAKLAERLLAAQMRREAVNVAQSSKGKQKDEGFIIDENTVYLEDLTAPSAPRTPSKFKDKDEELKSSPSTEKTKSKWRDYDPYRLPEVDLEAAVAKATRSTAPDPRLATEDELREFIERLRPEDLDVTSPEFRELPTEVQYEIIGDLRLKSRQISNKRLEAMLGTSKSPMDFSKAQIQNLKQRNELTQQLLSTTDSIGQAHLTIPVRIAAERNREYVLVKNEGAEGGWILGIRDDGTAEKPIEIDQDFRLPSEDDEDDDMEEINIPTGIPSRSDVRESQREKALQGKAKRRTEAWSKSKPRKASKVESNKRSALFLPEEGVVSEDDIVSEDDTSDDMDEDLALATAMQASMQDQEDEDLRLTLTESLKNTSSTPPRPTPSKTNPLSLSSMSSSDDFYATPSRLDTHLKFANTALASEPAKMPKQNVLFGKPIFLTTPSNSAHEAEIMKDSDEDMEEVAVASTNNVIPLGLPHALDNLDVDEELEYNDVEPITEPSKPASSVHLLPYKHILASETPAEAPSPYEQSELTPTIARTTATQRVRFEAEKAVTDDVIPVSHNSALQQHAKTAEAPSKYLELDGQHSGSEIEWSQSPSPNADGRQDTASRNDDHFDAAAEMNPVEEEGDFAQFISQVKGKDLDTVRREIEEEIRSLNAQRKAAMRDSEDVNQAMVAQIMTMLRLFGIPYITAPMEAEAQCAELVSLGLVDGVITDDSDVFLFGGIRVFKNMFNQSKTVECFLLADLARELGLDRGKLVRLAYLLGSDYVEGLAGVGPVVAMELLAEFPGEDGLYKFKDWWLKVQSGRDTEEESGTKFKHRFKRRFKSLYLATDWPNSAVRDAYYHPVVDSSEEPFKWGLPDLDGLRYFLKDELSWTQEKVDDLLLPIIQKMNKRSQANATNRQGTLSDFIEIAGGSMTTLEPRKRQVYSSKRLQELVSAHRKEQKRKADDVSTGQDTEPSKKSTTKRARKRKTGGNREAVSGVRSSTASGDENGCAETHECRPSKSNRGSGSWGRRGRGRGNKTRGGSRSQTSASKKAVASSNSGDESLTGSADAVPDREMKPRARTKPRTINSANISPTDECPFRESDSNHDSDFDDT